MRQTQFKPQYRVCFNPFAIVPRMANIDDLSFAEKEVREKIARTGKCDALVGPEWASGADHPDFVARWKRQCLAASQQRQYEREQARLDREEQARRDKEWEDAAKAEIEPLKAAKRMRDARIAHSDLPPAFQALYAEAARAAPEPKTGAFRDDLPTEFVAKMQALWSNDHR